MKFKNSNIKTIQARQKANKALRKKIVPIELPIYFECDCGRAYTVYFVEVKLKKVARK